MLLECAFMLVSLVTPTTLFRGGLMLPTKILLCVVAYAYTFIEMVSCVVRVKMDMLLLYIPTL